MYNMSTARHVTSVPQAVQVQVQVLTWLVGGHSVSGAQLRRRELVVRRRASSVVSLAQLGGGKVTVVHAVLCCAVLAEG
jgi:hypothetical protein